VNNCLIRLTATEEATLFILARHAGKVVPRRRLLRAIWGTDDDIKNNSLQVHITHLRQKFELHGADYLIQGEPGAGYSLALSTGHEPSHC
jgi:DNA-binding response OmpR family regulator